MILHVEIPGPPVPWQRAAPRRDGRGAVNTKKSRAYKKHVRACVQSAIMADCLHDWPTDARYDVEIRMYFPDRRTRDDDNVEKALKDALSAGKNTPAMLWADDTWVFFRSITKYMEMDRERPRVELTVRVVGESAA